MAVLCGPVLALCGPTAEALAAAPANDQWWNATTISALPFSEEVDTTHATVAVGDPDCGSSSNTIWYRFTPATTRTYTFSAGDFWPDPELALGVFTGGRRSAVLLDCAQSLGPDSEGGQGTLDRIDLQAGRTYHISVGTQDGLTSPGGSSDVFVQAQVYAPPRIRASLTSAVVDRRTGIVTLTGTADCTGTYIVIGEAGIEASLRQVKSGFVARSTQGYGWEYCEGHGIPWTLTMDSETARVFTTGWATLDLQASQCDYFTCDFEENTLRIRIRGS
jgi:hypothetical protein